jgi:hypothetical protein
MSASVDKLVELGGRVALLEQQNQWLENERKKLEEGYNEMAHKCRDLEQRLQGFELTQAQQRMAAKEQS